MEINELVEKARAGDQQAFGQLYDIFADRIFKFISIKVSDSFQAEDVLQDTFVKAWKGLHTLKLEDLNFSAWLYKIARNTVNDFYRKNGNKQTVELDESMPIPDANAEKFVEQMDIDFSVELLKNSLQKLPQQYRTVLELRYIQDFEIKEVAKILGKTNLAVRLINHRAIIKLKDIINNSHVRENETIR